jgi:hypothetical protein
VAGKDQRESEIFNRMMRSDARQRKHEPFSLVPVLIGLNRRQEAVQQLELSYREGAIWSLGFLYDPMLVALRNNPYFPLFMSKVSYPVGKSTDRREGLAG